MGYVNDFYAYLKWRGDLDFKKAPFNEVDALILSELVYIRFENIVPGVGEEGQITIREANARYIKSTEREMLYYVDKEILFDALALCPRFRDLTLCNYTSTLDYEGQQQFAAMHINLLPGFTFIAFRGTDSTVVGWREDCNMSFMMPVPAQKSAVDYVNKTAKAWFTRYYLGGHSKGGNLAIYSGVFCDVRIQKKIVKINSFDGPGFNRTMVDDEAYKRIEDRIEAFVPQSSIIGLLMEHEEKYTVVKSLGVSLLQHEGFSWQINCDHFEEADEIDGFSKNFSVTFKAWLKDMSSEQRKEIVDAFFEMFERAGIKDFTELASIDVKKGAALLKAVATTPQGMREQFGRLIKLLIEESAKP